MGHRAKYAKPVVGELPLAILRGVANRYLRSIMLFRRDLRLERNAALCAACAASSEVFPLFVLDPRQVEDHPYRSIPGFAFMKDALWSLEKRLSTVGSPLSILRGEPHDVLGRLLGEERIEAVFVNADYTPFSRKRDSALRELCERYGVAFVSYHDLVVLPPHEIAKADGSPYSVFTPFSKRYESASFPETGRANLEALAKKPLPGALTLSSALDGEPRETELHEKASSLLRSALRPERVSRREMPGDDGTSRLSVFLKFGVISPRTVYSAARAKRTSGPHPVERQLVWRDFFTHIGWHFPHVFEGPFRREYAKIEWRTSCSDFERWCNGETGFPLVDAGMRELNETGWMHNRVRMVCASFLVKDLLIDWREGERYFARRLVDYDPAVNNGNWQWCASTGCDAQPYFRIFNPWRQMERFDPECVYVKRWIPELSRLGADEIRRIEKQPPPPGYPARMIDHRERAEEAEALFLAAKER